MRPIDFVLIRHDNHMRLWTVIPCTDDARMAVAMCWNGKHAPCHGYNVGTDDAQAILSVASQHRLSIILVNETAEIILGSPL